MYEISQYCTLEACFRPFEPNGITGNCQETVRRKRQERLARKLQISAEFAQNRPAFVENINELRSIWDGHLGNINGSNHRTNLNRI